MQLKEKSVLKKTLFLLFVLFCFSSLAYCQSNESISGKVFKLYRTQNMWTFIKLNTKTGQLWQVHFAINNDGARGEIPLNTVVLSEENAKSGRFEVYSTDNMYNFLLLDTVDGRVWQFQWSFDSDKRGIIDKIN